MINKGNDPFWFSRMVAENVAYSKEIMRILSEFRNKQEENKMDKEPITAEIPMEFLKQAQERMQNSKSLFLCLNCEHRAVCKKIDEPAKECKEFMDATTYQRYSSINHFFQPVFDWIQYHYPAGEVKFIVDHNSAKMMIEHGPFVVDKTIASFNAQNQKTEQKDEPNEDSKNDEPNG